MIRNETGPEMLFYREVEPTDSSAIRPPVSARPADPGAAESAAASNAGREGVPTPWFDFSPSF